MKYNWESCTEADTAFFRKHGYPVAVTFENEPKWVVMQKHL